MEPGRCPCPVAAPARVAAPVAALAGVRTRRRQGGWLASQEYTARVKRRTFLATPLAALVPLSANAQPRVSVSAVSSFDPWVEIHGANLAHNISDIARQTKRPVL